MIDQIFVIVGITLLVMISPGPDMVIVTRNTIVGGRAAGLYTSLGILLGNFVHIAYCVVGIGWLISQSIVAFSILRYAGAAYLIYLGIMSLRSAGRKIELDMTASSENTKKIWLIEGFTNNILNPKGTLFYLGVFTMIITPETSISMVLVLIIVMKSVSALFWLMFVYTLNLDVVRRSFEKSQKTVNRLFGGLLILLGIRVAAMDQ
ncbi:MAG: LysE family translocator [Kordiimonadaceae bacterium]|nr:LysE family translocator [Kordiimonadaceae bacterium]